MNITSTKKTGRNDHLIILADKQTDWTKIGLHEEYTDIIKNQLKKEVRQIIIPSTNRMVIVSILENTAPEKTGVTQQYLADEAIRKAGYKVLGLINKYKIGAVTIRNFSSPGQATLCFAEGMAMGNYQFIRFKKDAAKEGHSLKEIRLFDEMVSKKRWKH